MAEKPKPRRYTEVVQGIAESLCILREDVAVVKAENIHANNHLRNIDGHLEKQNTSIDKHGNRLTALETVQGKPIGLSKKQAVGLGSSMIVIGGFIAGVINGLMTGGFW